ncbi:MAG: cysteine--tRNA ligase [Thermoleophilia bacterium]|nr:cysteine--tRNA ligase [Thermoleophilia bacterium]
MTPSDIRLHNTLSRSKEPLPTGPDGTVRMYVCGPTVYGPIHVGNARPFVLFSLLKRFLQHSGYRVVLASNLTDVNDKIYAAAAREGVPSAELAERYGREYVADTDRLGLGRPDVEPRVTDAIPEIVDMIARLVDRGLAYAAGGDVYFRVREFPGYGALSGRRLEEMLDTDPGPAKEHHLDFALWKGRKDGEDTFWDSPWGPGRPGWHIECSAMAHAALGTDFEIHGGGIDLVFPHHENEIAQSEGADGCRMAKLWVHNEMLELGGKMSKSDGNIVLLRDALAEWPAEVLVMFFLRSHYRSKLPYGHDALAESARAAERIRNTVRGLDRALAAPGDQLRPALARSVAEARAKFAEALADDFNTPGALAALFEAVAAVNAAVDGADRPSEGQLQSVRTELATMLDLLGLGALAAPPGDDVPADVAALVEARAAARAARDFAESDRLRDAIRDLGYEVRDTPDGQQVGPR